MESRWNTVEHSAICSTMFHPVPPGAALVTNCFYLMFHLFHLFHRKKRS